MGGGEREGEIMIIFRKNITKYRPDGPVFATTIIPVRQATVIFSLRALVIIIPLLYTPPCQRTLSLIVEHTQLKGRAYTNAEGSANFNSPVLLLFRFSFVYYSVSTRTQTRFLSRQ